MNGNFFAIKVNSLDQGVVYIGIDSITSIYQSSRFISGKGVTRTCCIVLANQMQYSTLASIDEVYAAIASMASVFSKVPEVGFQKAEPQANDIKPTDNDDTLDEHGFNPVQQEIADIVAEYSTLGRYNNFADAIDCVWAFKLHVDDADERTLTDICVEDGKMQVFLAGSDKPFDISYFSDMEQERLLNSLRDFVRWDRMYEWMNCKTDIAEYVAIHNEGCREPKYDNVAEFIHQNTEENINSFGLDAGALAKSMINGNYKKDDEWITVDKGELISTNDPCMYVDCILLTDWMLKHSEFAKNVMPEDTYAKIFG